MKMYGFKVEFTEREVTPILIDWKVKDTISIKEFLEETRLPNAAVEDKYFWISMKNVVRPIFKWGHIVAVVLNLQEGEKVK
jgi:hypothetical protein